MELGEIKLVLPAGQMDCPRVRTEYNLLVLAQASDASGCKSVNFDLQKHGFDSSLNINGLKSVTVLWITSCHCCISRIIACVATC